MKFRAILIYLLCYYYIYILVVTQLARALDTITPTRPIRDGETIISAGGTFELGFFSPGDPSKRYVGIWFKKVTTVTVAWVANRLAPVTDGKGVLRVTDQGELILQDQPRGIVWSSNKSAPGYKAVAQLLDSGNLVVRDGINGNFLWQSFDHPTDTLLAGMKLGKNRTSGFDRYLTSWRSMDDPYPGNFTYRIDANGFPEMMLRQGSDIKFSTGPWNGIRWSGAPNLVPNVYYHYEFVLTDEEVYYHYELLNGSVITRLYLSPGGNVQRFTWIDDRKLWLLYLNVPVDNCDAYNLCGPHGTCTITDSPVCACLKGFVPKSPQEWAVTDWSHGCTRRNALECETDIFVKYTGVKLPNTHYSWFKRSMNLQDCRDTCRKNCSCVAYSTLDIRDTGSGCLQWNGELVDIRNHPERGQEIYIRMSAAESGLLASNHNNQKMIIGLVFGSVAFIVGLCLFVYHLEKKIAKKTSSPTGTAHGSPLGQNTSGKEGLELPLFDLETILMATRNFSMDNKVGEGGFGPVYKGVLSDGQEIAVKKLSSSSRQGLAEFNNEVIYIAKLQHRNLVKLLGCCNQEENLLIYEYVHNGSLDSFLFDSTQSKLFDWKKRFNIMTGIARGLNYLHHDSRLRIIHRDVKASNILLDMDMNPKISDFGLARAFIGNDTGANTKRVVGTYGYMSPEYAIDGAFSLKSDVFSYGVLVLEIASGKRNRGFYHPNHRHNLLGHAWKLFAQNGKPLELLDPDIEESYNASEVLRCIHVGLLCVQRCPEDRPSMSRVVILLENETELPFPKEPGFFNERNPFQSDDKSSPSQQPYSPNEITMTQISPR